MRRYSYFALPCAQTVNHGLESLSCTGSKLWDSITTHMKEIDSINEFKHVIKSWKPDLHSCRLFFYKILDICSQQKRKKKKETHICLEKSEYHNRFFPFSPLCTLTFPCLIICWNLWNLFEF